MPYESFINDIIFINQLIKLLSNLRLFTWVQSQSAQLSAILEMCLFTEQKQKLVDLSKIIIIFGPNHIFYSKKW